MNFNSFLRLFGLVKVSALDASEKRNALLRDDLNLLANRVVQVEKRNGEMKAEQAKQERGNKVLWTAIHRGHRLNQADAPGTIREILNRTLK